MIEISKPHLLAVKSSVEIAEFQAKEIEKKLSLYQVFAKLYEHHRGLIEEIIQLENLSLPAGKGLKPSYVQGVIDNSTVYLVTNLGEDKTQTLLQPQQIWTIGRDRQCGICIGDKYLSRRHAAIKYIDNNEDESGFYLVDFKSTNGSFVNGKRVYQRIRLQEGDRIRLGSKVFHFFYNHTHHILPTAAMELLMQLASRKDVNVDETLSDMTTGKFLPKTSDEVVPFTKNFSIDDQHNYDGLSTEQKSDILDRFFGKVK